MSALLPDLLQIASVLLAGAVVAVLALAAFGLYSRLHRGFQERMCGGPALVPARGGDFPMRRTGIAVLAMLNERWLPARVRELLRNQLGKAGSPRELTPAELVALMELCCAGLGVAGVAAIALLELSAAWALLFALLGAGWPLLWLRDEVRARHRRIARALPYDLDLLTLSVEAGLDFAAAMAKVVEKGRPGPLADELSTTLKELKLGKTRDEALRNLARRCDLRTLTSFVQALVQADRMGTPLGSTLRILAAQMRVERTQRAEKLANQAPVKLLLPLIGCIFPTIFITLFGPIFYQMFLGGSF